MAIISILFADDLLIDLVNMDFFRETSAVISRRNADSARFQSRPGVEPHPMFFLEVFQRDIQNLG